MTKRNRYFATALALGLLCASPAAAKIGDLLPKPHTLTATGQTPFALQRAVRLTDPTGCTYLRNVLAAQGCTFDEGAAATVAVEIVENIPGAFNHNVNLFPDEAYSLEISTDAVRIQALTETGVIRAAQTLQQLAEGYEGGNAGLETLSMTDWPAFKVRGFMHDVGRSYLSIEELKREIDNLARFKVNVFHWHLTEKLAWRFEVKAYPQLTESQNMIRYAGQYYTQDECRELEAYAAERGVTVIPEIDMPGHSDVFTTAMGFSMQTDEGVAALKVILDEVIEVFPKAPYIHIGGDEVTITYPNFLKTMADYVRGKGKKVLMWNQLKGGAPTAEQCDMTQMWATAGKVVKGLPNIDCRYNYTNHFDVYADLVGIYKSNIYYAQQGTDEVAGTISAAWNDTKTASEADIVKQNNIYANILASAERAWYGGGKQYIEKGGTTLPNAGEEFDEFADFERRFLFHKAHSLQNEPIAYVKQTNVRWRITDPFPNNGDKALALPPETCTDEVLPHSFEWNGKVYGTKAATGAGIYLRHIWHSTVPSFFANPGQNQTAYAWTYVYSPTDQEAGAQIEFYTYSRSGSETAPPAGAWDRRGSKIWLNGEEIAAPEWQQPDAAIPQDHAEKGLTNENLTARPVVRVQLKAGWNKVFLRLPHVNNGGTGRDKWQFTFVLTDTEGKNALEGITYSPNKTLDAAAEAVADALDELDALIIANCSDAVGYYPKSLAAEAEQIAAEVRATLPEALSEEERAAQAARLAEALAQLRADLAEAEINQPKPFTEAEEHWYTFNTPYRNSLYPTSKGADAELLGEASAGKASTWKFEERTDGTFDIVNAADGLYISPDAANNSALRTVAAQPDKGWTVKKADEMGFVIITSGSVQFNQTNAGNGLKVFNWGGGSNTSDAGCKYAFQEVVLPSTPKLSTEEHTYWYEFNTPLRGSRYPTSQGAGQPIVGVTAPTEASVWKFMQRADGTFDIVNKQDLTYVANDAAFNSALCTSELAPATGWEFKAAATEGYFAIVSGSVQFNQTTFSGQNYPIYNWGGGSNTSDTGCQYAFLLVGEESTPTGISAPHHPTACSAVYDLSGRLVSTPARGLYIVNGQKRAIVR